MDLGLTGKAALVTGSSRGIGRGIALALSKAGCDVLLTGRDQAALAETASAIKANGRAAVIHAADLRAPNAAAELIDAARARRTWAKNFNA